MDSKTSPNFADIKSSKTLNVQAPTRRVRYYSDTLESPAKHVRSSMSFPFGSTEELRAHLEEHPRTAINLYQKWAQTGTLATRRTVGDEQFRANEANMLLNIYGQSFRLLHVGRDKCAAFRNACIDAMVEVLDEYGLREDLIEYMAEVLKEHVKSGIWRLLALYWVLSVDPKEVCDIRRHGGGRAFVESCKWILIRLPRGVAYGEVWERVVGGGRSLLYESVANGK